MKEASEYYGKMFPSAAIIANNRAACGEVFGYRADYRGLALHKTEAIPNRMVWD